MSRPMVPYAKPRLVPLGTAAGCPKRAATGVNDQSHGATVVAVIFLVVLIILLLLVLPDLGALDPGGGLVP